MDNIQKLKVLISMIPQLHDSPVGSVKVSFRLGSDFIDKYSFRKLTPDLRTFKTNCLNHLSLGQVLPDSAIAENLLTEVFAKKWLEIKTSVPASVWTKAFDYFYQLSRRTNENSFIHKNVKILRGVNAWPGGISLLDRSFFKVTDHIGSGRTTLIKIDTDFDIIETESIEVTELSITKGYKFYPDFLKVLAESCASNEVLISSTSRGDVLICTNRELIASKRRDRWTIYEPPTFKNSIYEIVGNYGLACSLYGILWDMSYKRHGGLIIVDKDENFSSYVTHPAGLFQQIVTPLDSYNSIDITAKQTRLLLELTSVDGATLVSSRTGKIVGFAGNVVTHTSCPNGILGARSVAAYSAALAGGISLKVSSDGDITILKQVGGSMLELKYT